MNASLSNIELDPDLASAVMDSKPLATTDVECFAKKMVFMYVAKLVRSNESRIWINEDFPPTSRKYIGHGYQGISMENEILNFLAVSGFYETLG